MKVITITCHEGRDPKDALKMALAGLELWEEIDANGTKMVPDHIRTIYPKYPGMEEDSDARFTITIHNKSLFELD